jgi:hypothetical protein
MIIPGRLPGLNDMTDVARKNKYKSAEMKKEYTELVKLVALASKIPHMKRIDLIISWYEPNMKRDKDNIQAGTKFILDGLVAAGIIDNDGWKQIGTIKHDVQLDKNNPRVEVVLDEVTGQAHQPE